MQETAPSEKSSEPRTSAVWKLLFYLAVFLLEFIAGVLFENYLGF